MMSFKSKALALVLALHSVVTAPLGAGPVIFKIYGEEIADTSNVAGTTPEDSSFYQAKSAIQQHFIEVQHIDPDSEKANARYQDLKEDVNIRTVAKLNDVLSASASIAESYINDFGENNVTEENIQAFYRDNQSSPVVSKLGEKKTIYAIKAYGKSKAVVENVKKHSSNTVEALQHKLKKSISGGLQSNKLETLLTDDQPITTSDIAMLKEHGPKTRDSIELSEPDLATSRASQMKRDYLVNAFIIDTIKKDAVIVDRPLFEKHLQYWQKTLLDPWKPAFPTAKTPTVEALGKR